MMRPEKVAKVCDMLHNVDLQSNIPVVPAREGLGPYAAVAPFKEEVWGAAQHQGGIAMWKQVTRS